MALDTILFTIHDGVARLTLNRPERLNAFTRAMHADIAQALTEVEIGGAARALVIAGAGRGFCAGQDLGERKRSPGDPAPDLGETLETLYGPLMRRLAALPIPTIAAVNGVAAGAGANLALACDMVIAKESARFIQSFSNIGLLPDAGGTWRLAKLIGQARATGLAMTGEPLDAKTAAEWGMIWRAAPDDAFEAEVEALATTLARKPTLALKAAKQALHASWNQGLDAQLDLERDLQRDLGRSADYAEGVAAFGEKRPAQFTGA